MLFRSKWRAARYGLEAIIIKDVASREALVTDDLLELLERLSPTARRLGCEAELAGVEDMLSMGAGYQRMRDAVADDPTGDVRAATRSMLLPR